MTERNINIRVPVLARVEGEGALEIDIENGQITNLKLNIFEPPRFFEKFLEGRHYSEVPDIVARICGICPVAYQMTAVHAFEKLFQSDPGPWVKSMRRLFYCGEWIESHALHIHLLAAPDFLGYDSAPEMAKDYSAEVRRGITLQNSGNEILRFLGGRSVHPIGVKVGGFHHSPGKTEANALLTTLKKSFALAEELIPWVASLDIPNYPQKFTSVALQHPDEYPFNDGQITSDSGLDITATEYEKHFTEQHETHSTALYSLHHGKPYLVGPLARLNLNFKLLPAEILNILGRANIQLPSNNMYHSIIARAVEIYFALNEAINILDQYTPAQQPAINVEPQAGIAYGCTEAPRGILWHRYEVDENGFILNARIVPPTSQNQARIEEDLKNSLNGFGLDQSEDAIRQRAEQIIRNYDPCISCATHFLNLKVSRL